MIGKVYKVLRPNFYTTYVVIFSNGDHFFDLTNSTRKINNILKGQYLNRPNNYVKYVQEEGYRLKYLGLTTTFITNYPELFI